MKNLILAISLIFFSFGATKKVSCTKTGSVNVGGTDVEVSVTADTCREARKGLRAAKKALTAIQ